MARWILYSRFELVIFQCGLGEVLTIINLGKVFEKATKAISQMSKIEILASKRDVYDKIRGE